MVPCLCPEGKGLLPIALSPVLRCRLDENPAGVALLHNGRAPLAGISGPANKARARKLCDTEIIRKARRPLPAMPGVGGSFVLRRRARATAQRGFSCGPGRVPAGPERPMPVSSANPTIRQTFLKKGLAQTDLMP